MPNWTGLADPLNYYRVPGQPGQMAGNQTWNANQNKWIDKPNATDPSQITNWMAEGQASGQGGLPDFFSQLSPENMQRALALLGPIFAQQNSALNRQQNTAMTGATNQAGAYAASRGIDNPMSLLSRARSGVQEQFAPQFEALRTQQMQAPLSLLGQQYQSLVAGKQFDFNRQNTLLNAGMQNRQYEDQNSFNFWRDAFPGILSGGAKVAAAAV